MKVRNFILPVAKRLQQRYRIRLFANVAKKINQRYLRTNIKNF
jgi:hypothetical protein